MGGAHGSDCFIRPLRAKGDFGGRNAAGFERAGQVGGFAHVRHLDYRDDADFANGFK
jgi:hypothetical protein